MTKKFSIDLRAGYFIPGKYYRKDRKDLSSKGDLGFSPVLPRDGRGHLDNAFLIALGMADEGVFQRSQLFFNRRGNRLPLFVMCAYLCSKFDLALCFKHNNNIGTAKCKVTKFLSLGKSHSYLRSNIDR